MARKITPNARRATTKAVGLKLPLTPRVAKTASVTSKPARSGAAKRTAIKSKPAKAAAAKRTPVKSNLSRAGTAKRAAVKRTPVTSKPARVAAAKAVPAKPTPAPVVKKIATPRPIEVPASRLALALPESEPASIQPALKLPTAPSKAADTSDNLVESRDMIATFESCGVAAAKGAETLGKEVVNYARGSMQAQFALAEALMNAKTMQEVLTAQNNYTQDRLGRMTVEFNKITDMSFELTENIMAPLQDSVRP